MAELKTQGTQLYLNDKDPSPAVILRIAKITSIDSLGGPASDIDITNLDSTAREYLVGLLDNGVATFGLNLDPTQASHIRIYDLAAGARYGWAIGCSDGTAPPTIGPDDGFHLPTTRSWFTFIASVQEATTSLATDDVVRVQSGLRITGSITFTPKV